MTIPYLAFLGVCSLFLLPQEKLEDNSWLRYKPGTWIKSKLTISGPGGTSEQIQTLKLTVVDGDQYTVEESNNIPGSKTSQSKRSRGVKTGTEPITVAGKPYECTVTIVKGSNDLGPTAGCFWTPVGSRNAVKVTFRQKGVEGELLATSVDDKVTALGRTLVSNTLKGKVKFGEDEGELTVARNLPL